MRIEIHPHARARMETRGASEQNVRAAIDSGECLPAKHGRTLYRRNLPISGTWRGKSFDTKRLAVYTVVENETILVITVVVKYF